MKSLGQMLKRPGIVGWVKSDTIPDIRPLIKEIAAQREENSLLKQQLEGMRTATPPDALTYLQGQITMKITYKSYSNRKDKTLTIRLAMCSRFWP